MATKNTAREAPADNSDMNAAGQNAMADITRQQLAQTASTTSAVLRALDSFQQAQQHMLQRVALLHSQSAERIRNAASPTEVMAVQSNLLMTGWNEMAQFAQEMLLATLNAQNDVMHPNQDASSSPSASPLAAAPLFQAWQSMMTASMNGASGAAGRHH